MEKSKFFHCPEKPKPPWNLGLVLPITVRSYSSMMPSGVPSGPEMSLNLILPGSVGSPELLEPDTLLITVPSLGMARKFWFWSNSNSSKL